MEDAAWEDKYRLTILRVSEIITEELLGDMDEVLEAGDRLDVRLRELMLAIGRVVMTQLLVSVDRQLAAEIDGRAERQDELRFTTVMGVVNLVCTVLRAGRARRSIRPLADHFGLRGGGRSVGVERALVAFGSKEAFGRASASFEEHYGVQIGRTSVLRVVERHGERAEDWLSKRWAREVEAYDLPPATRRAADLIFAQLDGGMVPTGEFQTARQAGRCDLPADKVVRPREWKEVRVGLAYGPGSVEPTYVARLGSYEAVGDELFAAAVHEGLGPDTHVVATADGGNGLREGLERVFPNLTFILDHPHLVQHLAAVAPELHPDNPSEWIDEVLVRLWDGEAEGVLAELRVELKKRRLAAPHDELDPSPELRKFIDYLDDHRDAVHYGEFDDRGWPIGSGRVESAHRFIPQARLKIPGATWSEPNVNRMLALRLIRQNGWWDEFWGDYSRTSRAA